MNINCTNCGKGTVVTFRYDSGNMVSKAMAAATGIKPFNWMGKADCPCGYETMAAMTVTCTKKDGAK